MCKISKTLIIFLQIIVKIQYIVGYSNPNYTIPATTVHRIETFANGCYTQIVREPDFINTQRFHETEQLICPPGVNITNLTNRNLTAYTTTYHSNNTQTLYAPSAPVYNPPYMQPAAHVPIVPIPPPAVPVQSNPGFIVPPPAVPSNSYPPMNPSTVHHSILQPTGGTSSNIVLLSNRSGFYDHGKRKNNGNSLHNINCIFVFVFLTIFCNYN